MAFNKALGAAVREMRELRGISQAELSRRCGVARALPHHWETGFVGLSAYRLVQVAEALGSREGLLLDDADRIATAWRAKRKAAAGRARARGRAATG